MFDIFVDCSCVDTRRQLYNTHLHIKQYTEQHSVYTALTLLSKETLSQPWIPVVWRHKEMVSRKMVVFVRLG